MAISVETHILHDGERNVVMQLIGRSDGSGQETNVVKVDVSELTPPCDEVKVKVVTYDVGGGLVVLSWAAVPNVPFLHLSGAGIIDYRRINGMLNLAPDASGDILLSTSGFELGSAYSITLEMIKKGVG